MINREDMLELTRRMTPARTCFDRIAGAYISDLGEVDESFNIHFGKLSSSEKARYLEIAKTIPFSKTNIQLKEYKFPDAAKRKDSMWQLLEAVLQCGLKNDALMEILYEQIADGFPVDYEFAISVFHGVYDVPLKGKDKESLWESEEVYDFIICTISPMRGEYEPAEPVFGFLYPAFSDRSADKEKIDIFHVNPEKIEEGLMYKMCIE
ncbi:MAG: DUF4317 family protein [Lachnospiraceae bacterium]|nr:DUF4317 family protein [Lachnospiraceae bacterium]